MAERKGFEPSRTCAQHAFQACALNRSATSLQTLSKGEKRIYIYTVYAYIASIGQKTFKMKKRSKIKCLKQSPRLMPKP